MNNRLYVGNLAYHTLEDELKRKFEGCGSVSEIKLMVDRESGRSRGFAFVVMQSDQEASNAIETLNGADLDGRALKVSLAEERRPKSPKRFSAG